MSAPSRSDEAEGGFTLIEVLLSMVLLSIVTTALMLTMTRAMETSAYAQDRNVALDQLRLMTATFSKDVRQGIAATEIDQDSLTFQTYVDGELATVSWQVSDDGDDMRLQRLVNGSTEVVYVVSLTTDAIFSYFGAVDPAAVQRVRLSLETQPDPRNPAIEVATTVEMRNAI